MKTTEHILSEVSAARETVWVNPIYNERPAFPLTMEDVNDAEARLARFAPFIAKVFPETGSAGGLFESPLAPAPGLARLLNEKHGANLPGKLLIKKDSDLPIGGSIKARGGIYEVLRHAEALALENGLLKPGDSYETLASERARRLLSGYTVQVGSTGNLGLSIGVASATLGFRAVVHMSRDAKQWKKDLLRAKGAAVIEYDGDYSAAVARGKAQSDQDPNSHFIDAGTSQSLFLGYAVAAKRLARQLTELSVQVGRQHPLFVYIPCGVGVGGGGVTFGLKLLFGANVHCFFVEPVQAPSMLLGLATGRHDGVCVQDFGLTCLTHADGMAVARPSGLVAGVIKEAVSGIFTVGDSVLYDYLRCLHQGEDVFAEPTSCAAFEGPVKLAQYPDTLEYLEKHRLSGVMQNASHIAWLTGGSLVPQDIRDGFLNTYI